jgi:hypothetical protein
MSTEYHSWECFQIATILCEKTFDFSYFATKKIFYSIYSVFIFDEANAVRELFIKKQLSAEILNVTKLFFQ